MKCVCGYEFEEFKGATQENPDFIRISGSTFKIRSTMRYGHEKEVHLLACPKCDTIKMCEW